MKKAAEPLDVSIELFKAFADRVRLRLLNLLAEGELCVCHLHGRRNGSGAVFERKGGWSRF